MLCCYVPYWGSRMNVWGCNISQLDDRCQQGFLAISEGVLYWIDCIKWTEKVFYQMIIVEELWRKLASTQTIKKTNSPDQCVLMIRMSAWGLKGHEFNSWSRAHTWVAGSSPLRSRHIQETTNECVSLTSMFLFLSPHLTQGNTHIRFLTK